MKKEKKENIYCYAMTKREVITWESIHTTQNIITLQLA